MSDKITDLPASYRGNPTQNDIRVMQAIFGESFLAYELKRLVVPTLTFVLLSLPIADATILKLMPTASFTTTLIIKIVAFVVVLILAQLMGIA